MAGSRKAAAAAAAAAASDDSTGADSPTTASSGTTAVRKAGSRGVRFGSDDSSVSSVSSAAAQPAAATATSTSANALSPKGAGHGRSPSVKDLANVFSKVSKTTICTYHSDTATASTCAQLTPVTRESI
jgi:hypothetical protein